MTYKTNRSSSTSYKGETREYHRPSSSRNYASGLPPTPKPYDLKGAMKNVGDYEHRNPNKEKDYTFARPNLYRERPGLNLRTICPLCKQSLKAA